MNKRNDFEYSFSDIAYVLFLIGIVLMADKISETITDVIFFIISLVEQF